MPFVPILLGLLLIFGGSAATVAASDSAKPGDFLFPIDRATENVRLAITMNAEAKARLEAKFAEERIEEAEEIIAEVRTASNVNANVNSNTNTSSSTATSTAPTSPRAAKALNQAIDVLTEVRAKLQAHGNINAAIAVQATIDKLKFMDAGYKPSDDADENENDDADDDNDNRNTNSTTNTNNSSNTNANANANTNVSSMTMATIATHNTASSCWTVVNNSVYDLTTWIAKHPGGQSAILQLCGKNGTAAFMKQHSGQSKPESTIASFKIGTLGGQTNVNTNTTVNTNVNGILNSGFGALMEVKAETHDNGNTEVEVTFTGEDEKFIIQSEDRDAIINEVVRRYGVTRAQVEAVFTLKIE